MSGLRRIIVRLAALLRGRRLNAELDQEVAAHLAEAADEYRRRGLSENDARLAALRDFGGVAQTKEAYRDVRGFPWLDALGQDLPYAVRVLRKSPGFTAAAVATLALGIGANSAIFTVIDAVMLRALPVPDPQRLVFVGDEGRVHAWSNGTPRTDVFSFPLYREVRDHNEVFSSLSATARVDDLTIAIDGAPEDITGRMVTGDYFETLGVRPWLGRTFTAAEDRMPGADPYVVVSYAYWQRRFAGDPSVIGRTVRLKHYPFTIIGIAPPEFFGEVVGDRPDIWAPMMMEPELMPGRDFLEKPNTAALIMIGRLKAGVSLAQARAAVAAAIRQALTETLAARLSADDRSAIAKGAVRFDANVASAARGLSRLREDFTVPLLVLMGMVAIVLLVACVNVANLMLARSTVRRREIAVRLALGAAPARIVWQLLTESLALAALGGACGLLVAHWGAVALVRFVGSAGVTPSLDLGVDGHVLGFTALVCLAAALLFGLAPALRLLHVEVPASLQDVGTDARATTATSRAGRVLVSAQVALGVVVVMAAGLLVRSLRNLEGVDLGYHRGQLLIARVDLLPAGYAAGVAEHQMIRQLLDRFSMLPGVRKVTLSSNGLFSRSESADAIRVEGYTPPTPHDRVTYDDQVGPDYFSTIGAPILRGREITEQDFARGARVVVVNDRFARFYFGARDPIGAKIFFEDADHPNDPPYEIVGVARDIQDHDVRAPVERRLYAPLTAGTFDVSGAYNFELLTDGDPKVLTGGVRAAIRALDPRLVLDSIDTADLLVDNALASSRMVATLSLCFGALVVVLICVGLYGSMAYAVVSRTKEIGVRMALGARPGTVIGLVAREAGLTVAAGLAAGLPLGVGVTHLFRAMLFGLGEADPVSMSVAIAVVVLTSAAAATVPARRATRVDPMVALRHE